MLSLAACGRRLEMLPMPVAITAELRYVELVADSMLEQFLGCFSFCLDSVGIHVPCHSSPCCALRGARFRCCIVGLGAAARLHHAVVLLDFVVLEPVELLLFRSVAVGPMLVAKLVIVGVNGQNRPLPSSWGLLCWR